jgi:hypothetical protein
MSAEIQLYGFGPANISVYLKRCHDPSGSWGAGRGGYGEYQKFSLLSHGI